MAISDERGNAIFSSNGNTDTGEGEELQEKLLEAMYKYQQYAGIMEDTYYALRGSVIFCEYGTKDIRLDCVEDYGVLKDYIPVLTTKDCKEENIHYFGSCLCPEKIYKDRVPMTAAHHENGEVAKKATGNEFAHICVPLVHEWRQVDKKVLIEVNAQEYAPMLTDNAVLVCQRSGIIFIKEVPPYGIYYDLSEEEKKFIAVVAGESIGQGPLAWKVIANVIMNRVGSREWSEYKTPSEVMIAKFFSCLLPGYDEEYQLAMNYLENRVNDRNRYEQLISTVMPIYHKEVPDITGGAQLYYSPRSMKPPYSKPDWAASYKQIYIEGIDPDDFVIFTGEKIGS